MSAPARRNYSCDCLCKLCAQFPQRTSLESDCSLAQCRSAIDVSVREEVSSASLLSVALRYWQYMVFLFKSSGARPLAMPLEAAARRQGFR